MLKDIDWPETGTYRSGSDSNREPLEFFIDAFSNSTNVQILLGYFSFAAINVISEGFALFLANGGRLQVVANHVLSEQDKNAIVDGNSFSFARKQIDLNDVRTLRDNLNEYGVHFFECVAWLIQQNRIEIKLIRPKGKNGIAHSKEGLFFDGEDYVRFSGSMNFTAYGLVENMETVSVDLGWSTEIAMRRIREFQAEFDSMIDGRSKHVEYVDVENAKTNINAEFGGKDLNELIMDEQKLLDLRDSRKLSKRVRISLHRLNKSLEALASMPRFPFANGPRPYQVDAYHSWVKNSRHGVFAMATGTGKTITALSCVLSEYLASEKAEPYYAVITVPTLALVDQWREECEKFNFQNVICISSRTNWAADLDMLLSSLKYTKEPFVLIATYASFCAKGFYKFLQRLPVSAIFIADEAHNLGEPRILKLLPELQFTRRIGLSATPERMLDEDGNEKIEEFFNDRPPYTVSFSMREALDKRWLCPFEYYPVIVELEEGEQEEYDALSSKIAKFYNSSEKDMKKNDALTGLLLKRKRIVHKANGKLSAFKQIISREFNKKGTLAYTLVYAPEGFEPDYSVVDSSDHEHEGSRLIDEYTRVIRGIDKSITVAQFTSSTKNRSEQLIKFASGDLEVLTSMKCLDEGVDVPRAELAIFCSSTGNPRQFIQRRGRVLRQHPEKTHSVIYDLVVIPWSGSDGYIESSSRSLVKSELKRVVNFSELSMNKTDTYLTFEHVLERYDLNLTDI